MLYYNLLVVAKQMSYSPHLSPDDVTTFLIKLMESNTCNYVEDKVQIINAPNINDVAI